MKVKIVCFVFAIVFSSFSLAEKLVQWEMGEEIIVPIYRGIDGDKKIKFSEPVSLGVTDEFSSVYRYQNVGTIIYLKSKVKNPPKTIKVLAKGLKSEKTYILVIKLTMNEIDAEPLKILINDNREDSRLKSLSSLSGNSLFSKKEPVTAVDLVRYASQQLYAPKFAIEHKKGITTSTLAGNQNYDFIYPGDELEIRAIAAFTSGTNTVTAFSAKNKSKLLPLVIDVKKIAYRVNAVGASAQYGYLGVDDTNNETALYIVTNGDLRTNLKVGGVR